jgi:hypothetical protein
MRRILSSFLIAVAVLAIPLADSFVRPCGGAGGRWCASRDGESAMAAVVLLPGILLASPLVFLEAGPVTGATAVIGADVVVYTAAIWAILRRRDRRRQQTTNTGPTTG